MSNVILAKVTYWDEVDEVTKKAVHVYNAYSLQDAAKQLEDYYGDIIEKVHIIVYEEGLPTFPVDMYKQIDSWLSGEVEEK